MQRGVVVVLAKKSLCVTTNALKYELLNNIKKPLDQNTHVNRRRLAYKHLFTLYQQNQQSDVKARHLYVLMYSKYFTQRFIIREVHPDVEDTFEEDDEALKQAFHAIFSVPGIKTREELETRYLNAIRIVKKSEEAFLKYKDLNKRMSDNMLSDEERELFYIGSSETDAYVERKLALDLSLFKTKGECFVEFLSTYRFVNGWITNVFLALWTAVNPSMLKALLSGLKWWR